jgi:hypothetical protein
MVAFLIIVVVFVIIIIIVIIISAANSRFVNLLTEMVYKANILHCKGLNEPFGDAVTWLTWVQ